MSTRQNSGSAPGWIAQAIGAVLLLTTASSSAVADTLDAVRSPADALANTAAVIEGHVARMGYTYDPAAGPRTVATFDQVKTHLGRLTLPEFSVATLSGPITQNRWLYIPELPQLAQDTRYIVFVTNVDWFYSPVVADYLFRIERRAKDDAEVLIAPSGHAVLDFSARGLLLSRDPATNPTPDFLTPLARPKWLDTAPRAMARAMTKGAFLAAVRRLATDVPPRGDVHPRPDPNRVWNRGQAAIAARDDKAPGNADDLVCVSPGAQKCIDSSDR